MRRDLAARVRGVAPRLAPRHPRAGFTLLELLVAIALLGVTGTALAAAVGGTRRTMEQVHDAELRTRRATTLLAGLARESRETLARRAGRRRLQGHEVRVSQVDRELFAITVLDTATREVLAATTVYRAEAGPDAR